MWQKPVVVPGCERGPANELESDAGHRAIELLVLVPAVDPDEAPGQMVMDGRHRARGNHEAEQRKRAIGSAKHQPLPDAAAHSALGRRLLKGRGQPAAVGEYVLEQRA